MSTMVAIRAFHTFPKVINDSNRILINSILSNTVSENPGILTRFK